MAITFRKIVSALSRIFGDVNDEDVDMTWTENIFKNPVHAEGIYEEWT
jgi:hypothetical protein